MSASAQAFLGPRIARIGFLVLVAAFGLNFAAGQFFAPLGEARGWSVETLSAAAALNAALSGIAQPILGRLIDGRGPRPVIAASLAAMGLAYVAVAVATEPWQFFAAYGVLGGVGFAGSSSLAVTVLVSRWYSRGRASVLPRVFLGINVGQLTIVPLGGALIEALGYSLAYLALGLIVLLAVVPVAALFLVDDPRLVGQLPDGRPGEPATSGPVATVRAAVGTRAFWLLTIAFGINGWTLYFTLLHLPRLAGDLGGDGATGGVLIALAALVSAVTMLVLPSLAGRVGKRRVVIGLFGLRATTLALVALLVSGAGQLAVLAAIFGAASFPVIPLMMGLISERFGTAVLGGVLGIVFVSHQLFAALGVFSGGLLRGATGDYDAALLLGAVVLSVGIVLLARVRDVDLADEGSEAAKPIALPVHTVPEAGASLGRAA